MQILLLVCGRSLFLQSLARYEHFSISSALFCQSPLFSGVKLSEKASSRLPCFFGSSSRVSNSYFDCLYLHFAFIILPLSLTLPTKSYFWCKSSISQSSSLSIRLVPSLPPSSLSSSLTSARRAQMSSNDEGGFILCLVPSFDAVRHRHYHHHHLESC